MVAFLHKPSKTAIEKIPLIPTLLSGEYEFMRGVDRILRHHLITL